MNDLRSILRRIGGRHAITWQSFWVVFVLNAVIYLSSNLTAVRSGFTVRLLIVAISQLTMYVVPFVVWMLWVRRSEHPRPIVMSLGFIGAGVVRGLTIVVVPEWLVGGYAPTVGEWILRLSASAAFIPVTLAIMAIYSDLTFENAERSAELARYQRDAAAVEHLVFERMRENQSAVVARIRAQLERMLTFQDPADLVAELRVSVDDVVRPLSHTLAKTIPTVEHPATDLTRARIPWPDLLTEVGRMPLFMPTLTSLVVVVASGPWLLLRPLSAQGLMAAVATLAVTWMALTLGNVVWLHLQLTRPVAVVAVATAMAILTALSWWPMFRALGGPELDPMMALTLAYFMIASWFFSLPRAADRLTREHSAAVDKAIRQLNWEMARAQASAWQQQRNFAYALHGPLQSAMTAIIFRLEAALSEGELSPNLRAEIEHELMSTLESLTTTTEEVTPFTEVVEDIRRLWSGIVEVEFSADPSALAAAESDNTTNTVIVDVTREACSNAVRHGRAANLRISLRWRSSSLLELTITNDGADAVGDGGSGLGTQLLNEATVSWSRTRQDALTVLTALVPVALVEYAI